jgi:hypothetical protein
LVEETIPIEAFAALVLGVPGLEPEKAASSSFSATAAATAALDAFDDNTFSVFSFLRMVT